MINFFKTLSLITVIAVSFLFPIDSRCDLIGHGGMVRAVDVSPDGRFVMSGSFDYTARVWDFSDQTEIVSLEAHEGPVTSVKFFPNGEKAVSTSDDATAIIWDLSINKPHKVLRGHKHKVMTAAVSDDNLMIATGSWDRTIRLWDVKSGKSLRSIDVKSPVNAIAFLSSKIIASGHHDPFIRLWNTETGNPLGSLEGHMMGITSLDVSPTRKNLLSSSIDKTIRIWDTQTLQEIKKIDVHNGQVFGAKFSPDGKSALTAGKDGYVIQWDLTRSMPLRKIHAHDEIVWAVDFAANGRFAVSASSDDQVRVWHLQSGDRIGNKISVEKEAQPWLKSDHPGAALFTKCARCHSLTAKGPKRSGPHFEGLFGRKVGSVPDYRYTDALRSAEFIWNEKTIFQLFQKGPDVIFPGTKMPIQRVTDERKLMALVMYLRELTDVK